MLFKHAEMVSVAVATFNINQTVQLVFPPVVKYLRSQLNHGESAPWLSTSYQLRQCRFNERRMEQSRCAFLETPRPRDLIKHA